MSSRARTERAAYSTKFLAENASRKDWGATPEEWARLKKLAEIDLLPVVSNPGAVISPKAKLKGLGKTPSRYNRNGEVSGFIEWTDHQSTPQNIDVWSAQPDYGICVQTREIRALDIDVSDPDRADLIERMYCKALGLPVGSIPCRIREDSSRRLLAFKVSGLEDGPRGYLKRGSFKVEDGLVEFLATGQQFIAAGTHKDGARYEWRDGLPTAWPTFDWRAVKWALEAIADELGIPNTWRGFGDQASRSGGYIGELDVEDPVAEHLIESGWTTYDQQGGKLFIECPWIDGHSSDSGETETAWLLAGTGQYRNGHFACLHASCAGRKDSEFFQAVGYKLVKPEAFEDLTQDPELAEAYVSQAPGASSKAKELRASAKLPLPGFNRDRRGQIETSLDNLVRALKAPQACECEIAFDPFRGELILAEQPGQWRSFKDADGVELRIRLEALGFTDRVGRELLRDALEVVGRDNQIDTAILWLESLPRWDGVPRLCRLFPDHLSTKDTPYTQQLGIYVMTAHAARILSPGCQVDMVPVLVSPEGYAKTSVVAALSPRREFFSEFNLHQDDEKLARLMRGCLVGELAELRGISAREGEPVKAWITRREEKWTPKFKEYATTLPRRLVFWGTTNDHEFMQPHMGLRRWLPVEVLEQIDLKALVAVRDQLWAEARDIYLLDGICWEEVERLAHAEREQFQHVDPWHHKIAKWLDADPAGGGVTPRNSGTLRVDQVLWDCLGIDHSRLKKVDQMRVGEVLKVLGMARKQGRLHGANVKVWVDVRRHHPK